MEIIIPPPVNAAPGSYGTREAQIERYKQVIAPSLRSRKMETQSTETRIGINALNRMTNLGRAAFERVS